MIPVCRCCGLSLAVVLAVWTSPLRAAEPPVRLAPASSPPVATPYVIPLYEGGSAPVVESRPDDGPSASEFSPVAPLQSAAVAPAAVSDPHCPACNLHPEPAFGASYHAIMRAQVAKGEAAQMVLYQYDFVRGQAALNYRGRLRLQKIARLAPQNPFPIIIEANRYDPELDAARQAQVVTELSWAPFPVPAQRVVVGLSPERGLDGLDAVLIHQSLLNLSDIGGSAGQTATPGSGMGTPVPVP